MPANAIQVQKFLGGIDYPVKKADLIQRAKDEGATRDFVSALETLPDRDFSSPDDVSETIGDPE